MKHVRVVFDSKNNGSDEVQNFATTGENAAAIEADMREGRAVFIEQHEFEGNRMVKVSTTVGRVDRIKYIEIKDR